MEKEKCFRCSGTDNICNGLCQECRDRDDEEENQRQNQNITMATVIATVSAFL
jgi:hypothetical protein